MSFLLLSSAAPLWLFLMVIVPQSTGWSASADRFLMAPLALVGMTIVLHRLFRTRRNAWASSALIAGVLAYSTLFFAAWMAG